MDDKVLKESVLVEPVESVSDVVFPYLMEAKDAILDSDTFKLGKQTQTEENTSEI